MGLKTAHLRRFIHSSGDPTTIKMLAQEVLLLADLLQIKHQFVKDGPGWWISFFKDPSDLHVHVGLFKSSDPVHLECIQFCFMQILRNEPHNVAEMWNQHLIASSKFGNSSGPIGRPDCMFFLPHLYNSEDYKVPVNPQEAEEFIDESTMCPTDCKEEFNEFALTVMNALELHLPNTVNDALDVYVTLIKEVKKLFLSEERKTQTTKIQQLLLPS